MLVHVRPSNEALSGRAFREHRTNVGVIPVLYRGGSVSNGNQSRLPPSSSIFLFFHAPTCE